MQVETRGHWKERDESRRNCSDAERGDHTDRRREGEQETLTRQDRTLVTGQDVSVQHPKPRSTQLPAT